MPVLNPYYGGVDGFTASLLMIEKAAGGIVGGLLVELGREG